MSKCVKPTEIVTTEISVSNKELMSKNWDCLKKLLNILSYLAKQGLPLRGHD